MQQQKPNDLIVEMKHSKLITIFLLLLLSVQSGIAQIAPEIDWKVMENDHAIWIYDSRQKELVHQYAKHFQKVFPQLQKLFVEFPEKTTFVISDQTDAPNGSATVFPYPLITIFPVIPLPTSPIGETDDSFFEIICHEYTHILNLYPVHGGMRILHAVFGSLIHPNMLLPRWYVEGLAVYSESYFNPKGGRLRSQNFEGVVRAISSKNEWGKYTIDELNEFIPDWLGGNRAYLLGGAYMQHLAENYKLESLHELNQASSRRLPFFISGMLDNQTGKSASELLDSTFLNLQTRAQKQFDLIKTAPISEGVRIPQSGNMNYRPVISPDGKYLAYISSNHNVPSSVHILTRNESGQFNNDSYQVNPATDSFGVQHITWSHDSKILAFNLIKVWKRFYQYSDIHFYDTTTKETRQVTFGARVGDMIFTNDDNGIFFVQNIPGSKQLSFLDLKTQKIHTLYTPAGLGTNIWSLTHKEENLLFIEQNSEKRVLKSFNIATRSVTTINETAVPTSLRITPHGILFSSSLSGVDNLYLSSTEDFNQKKAVTNSLTRIFDGTIDPINKTLYYSEQKEDGLYIYSTPQESWQKITTAPHVEPLLQIPPPEKIESADNFELKPTEEKNFSPMRYMYPRHWMPYGSLLDGGVLLQANTSFADPLEKNVINLGAQWDNLTKKVGGSVNYINNSTPVSLSFTASQVYRYLYNTDSSLKDTGYLASGRFYLSDLNRRWTMGLEGASFSTEFINTTLNRTGPAVFLSYNNARQLGFEISQESGTAFTLSHQSFIKAWGNVGYDKTNLSARYYFSKWLPSRHVFFSQVNATYAPKLNIPILYTSTIGGNFVSNTLIPPFLMRGYSTGTLLGNNVAVGNFEYRFPIANIYSGWGTFPLFFKQVYGGLVADTISLDGVRYSNGAGKYIRSDYGRWFWGYGAEVHLNCTIGYYLPVKFTFGVYHGQNKDIAQDSVSTFFNFSM